MGETEAYLDHAFMFFNEHERTVVAALAERLFPTDDLGPGATAAGVVLYIDRVLGGFGVQLQRLYRRGIVALDEFASDSFAGRGFLQLDAEEQDRLLLQMEQWHHGGGRGDSGDKISGPLLGSFFAAVREHTIQGMFCDPMYGGNRDFVGWRLVGFPGAKWGYTEEQMKSGFDAQTIEIQSLADLRRARLGSDNTASAKDSI